MIEVNRRLYMDEGEGTRNGLFSDTAAAVRGLVRRLVDETRRRRS